jgi:hypothetical protein
MKVSSYLFALLAFGALSTDVAAAEKPKTDVAAGIGLKRDSNTKAAIGTAPTTQIGDAPSISGTGLIRPGASTGAVGGPARAAAGVVSGNSVHLKHP